MITTETNGQTAVAAKLATDATWTKTAITGLYLRSNGTYYSRYSLNGKRTWRSLNTDVFSVAKLRHAKATGDTEVARQSGTQITGSARTLGDLAALAQSEMDAGGSTASVRRQYRIWIGRVRAHWIQGDFDATPPRAVTRETILRLRTHLSSRASLLCQRWTKEKRGYAPAAVNQALNGLRILLDIAVQHHAIAVNPFTSVGPFGGSLFLPKENRRPTIPGNADMERVFAEMARPVTSPGLTDGQVALLVQDAASAADFARFLAYTGMRLGEAVASQVEDDKGTTMAVRGTKTETSARTIPVIPPLRALLDRIRADKIGGPMFGRKSCIKALRNACIRLGVQPLRHHDLRHYFATACVESGVPIPTIADWLGHSDGGALLMRTYRHLRQEHSIEAAKLVTLQPAVRENAG